MLTPSRVLAMGPTFAKSVELLVPLPHLHRDWGSPLPGLGSPLAHLHQDWVHCCHICTGTQVETMFKALPAETMMSPELMASIAHSRVDTGTGWL